MRRNIVLSGLRTSAALAAILIAVPVHLDSAEHGWLAMGWDFAWAESGSGSDGDGDESEDDEEDEEDDDEVDDEDDEDDDDEDDEDDDDEDDDDDDDNSGPGGGDSTDDGQGDDSGLSGKSSGGEVSRFLLKDGTHVEISDGGHDIVLVYSNGWREEIRSGRYVLRDDRNRLVVDRAATADDYYRLQDLLDA